MEELKQFLKSVTPHAIACTAGECTCPEVTALSCWTPCCIHTGSTVGGEEQYGHPLVCPRWHRARAALFVQQRLKGEYRCHLQLQPLLKQPSTLSWQFPLSLCDQLFFLHLWNKLYCHKLGLKWAFGWAKAHKIKAETWAYLRRYTVYESVIDSNHDVTMSWKDVSDWKLVLPTSCIYNVTVWFHAD